MTFKQAYAQMKALAAGRYFSMYYELSEHAGGEPEARCRLYLDPGISHDNTSTWEEAFAALDAVMHPEHRAQADMEEAPE